MKNQFTLVDRESAEDLQAFLVRAKRLDPEGLVRLRAFGTVLAAYVAPIFSGNLMDSGPTVLGLRTTLLSEEAEVESLVSIVAVLDRLARVLEEPVWHPKHSAIILPASERAPWAGISPPRCGWLQTSTISEAALTEIAKNGIAEVADTLPEAVGGPIAARIRGDIWGRSIDLVSSLPTGAAFVAAGLGFLTEEEEIGVFEADGWVRLSSLHGHVLARAAKTFS
jgi:hypothetical protein